jgi:hypothetical protein
MYRTKEVLPVKNVYAAYLLENGSIYQELVPFLFFKVDEEETERSMETGRDFEDWELVPVSFKENNYFSEADEEEDYLGLKFYGDDEVYDEKSLKEYYKDRIESILRRKEARQKKEKEKIFGKLE